MADPLRIMLVDDEPLARLRLRSLLGELTDPRTSVIGEADSAAQALRTLQLRSADVVLLDIAMPGDSGLELAARLAALPAPPAVVFVTAHGDHALRAFELDAADYLTKPVRRDRLQAALQRVAQRRAMTVAPADGPVLVVSDRGRVLRLPVAEVLYLKAELKYVTLRTASHRHVLDDALSELEQRLGDDFLRIHRNALVARAAVRELQFRPASEPGPDEAAGDGWAVRVAPTDEWLAVSRRQLPAVRQALAGRDGPG